MLVKMTDCPARLGNVALCLSETRDEPHPGVRLVFIKQVGSDSQSERYGLVIAGRTFMEDYVGS